MIKVDSEEEEAEKDDLESMELCQISDQPMPNNEKSSLKIPPVQATMPIITPQKRVRVGLSKRTLSTLHQSTVHNRMTSPISPSCSNTTSTIIPESNNHNTSSSIHTTSNHSVGFPTPSAPLNTNTVPLK